MSYYSILPRTKTSFAVNARPGTSRVNNIAHVMTGRHIAMYCTHYMHFTASRKTVAGTRPAIFCADPSARHRPPFGFSFSFRYYILLLFFPIPEPYILYIVIDCNSVPTKILYDNDLLMMSYKSQC